MKHPKISNNTYYNSDVNTVNSDVQKIVKNRRPRRSKDKFSKKLTFFSCNSAGIKNKMLSFSKVLNDLQISVFCLQETHLTKEGQIKFENSGNYQIYEKLRSTKSGGGLAVGVLNDLNPVWLGEGEDNVKAISIQISVKGLNVRIVNAYGPQEYDDQEKRNFFGFF